MFLLLLLQNKLAKGIYTATFKSLNTKIIANDEMHKFYKQKALKTENCERDGETQQNTKAERAITIE